MFLRVRLDADQHLWVLLLPVTAHLAYLAWPYFADSFKSQEVSMNAGGLILQPAKALPPAGFARLVVRDVMQLGKRFTALAGAFRLDTRYEAPLQ